jgi:hypothetical protein
MEGFMVGLSIGFLFAYILKSPSESDRLLQPLADAAKGAGKMWRSADAVRGHRA